MKRSIIVLFMLITGFTLQAKQLTRDTAYKPDPMLNRFDGTWEYSDNNTIFRIVLKTEKVYNTIYYNYIDFVSGYHLYIKNKKIIQNSIGKKKTLTYGSYLNMEVSKNILKFIFDDIGRPRSADAIVELLPDGRLKWKLKNRGEGFRFVVKGAPEPEKEDRNFYVPKDLILTKIK